jgi:hypothetical protein
MVGIALVTTVPSNADTTCPTSTAPRATRLRASQPGEAGCMG